jgi:subtilase family serine protease
MIKPSIVITMLALLSLLAISPIALSAYAASGFSLSGSSAELAQTTIAHVNVGNAVSCTPTEICPSLMQTAYGVDKLLSKGVNGSGQSIVIIDSCEEQTIQSDLKAFDAQFGLPNPTLNIYYPQGTCTEDWGWGDEISLDVEWSHVMAPAATINLVIAQEPSFSDLLGAWKYALANNLGNEISNSWGGTTACSSAYTKVLKTAEKQDVTVLAATGDSAAWAPGPGSSPANCLGVLGVGGTSLSITSSGTYISESAWSDGGGGYVTGTAEPSYQLKANITDPSKLLGKPDVSADADPYTGVWIYNLVDDGGWSCCWGGTSLPTPMWAGFLSDVNQIRATNGYASLGLVNSYLYLKVYGVNGASTKYATDFHDVTTGSNGFPAGKGWDAATGIGSYVTNKLAYTLGDSTAA